MGIVETSAEDTASDSLVAERQRGGVPRSDRGLEATGLTTQRGRIRLSAPIATALLAWPRRPPPFRLGLVKE
jgi:hypothetical protein